MVSIVSNWVCDASCSVPSNTTGAYASFSVPHYPYNGSSNSLPTCRNAIFPMLGVTSANFLQPVLACGSQWNGFNGGTNGGWCVVGYYFNSGGTNAYTLPVDVPAVGTGLQGYILKSGNDWLCGMNITLGATPAVELHMSNPGFVMSGFGCVIEWRGWNDANGLHTVSTDCNDLIADTINFTQIGIEAGGVFPTISSWVTTASPATGCGTKSATVISSANPNGSVRLRPQ